MFELAHKLFFVDYPLTRNQNHTSVLTYVSEELNCEFKDIQEVNLYTKLTGWENYLKCFLLSLPGELKEEYSSSYMIKSGKRFEFLAYSKGHRLVTYWVRNKTAFADITHFLRAQDALGYFLRREQGEDLPEKKTRSLYKVEVPSKDVVAFVIEENMQQAIRKAVNEHPELNQREASVFEVSKVEVDLDQ